MLKYLYRLSLFTVGLTIGVNLLAGCAWPGATLKLPTPTLVTPIPSASESPTATSTITASATATPTRLPTSTATPVPSPTPTPTVSPTPTSEFPQVRVLMQAFCRYGPGKAYLYSHGLYEGDRAQVDGRNYNTTWLWIKPENLDRHCWVSTSVVEVAGDLAAVVVATTSLPHSTLYGPPAEIEAVRKGDTVIVRWEPVWMTEDDDRGYLIEATLCQNGALFTIAVQTDKPVYEFTDERNCPGPSGGLLYTVEKHGYTDPVTIPWP